MNFRKKYFFNELKRAIKSKNMLIAVSIGILLIGIGFVSEGPNLMRGGAIAFQCSVLDGRYSRFFLFLPLITSIPFSFSFLQEYESGMFKNITNKIKVKEYIFIKILVVSISSFLVAIIPLAIIFIICHLFFGIQNTGYSSINFTIEEVYTKSVLLYGIIQSLFIAFFGIVISLISLAMTTFTNKIISLLTPFILVVISANIRVEGLYFLNIQSIGDISILPDINLQIRVLYGFLLVFISIGVFSYNVYKRCSYE
ncbi:MAG: hypothetical protein ACRCWG_11075 [Sarcina sp.]